MERANILFVCILAVSPIQVSAAEDNLCSELRAFQAAPFQNDAAGKPIRRAIEFHWIGFWLDFKHSFGTQCHDGGSAPGKAVCAWLPENTSTEFPGILPMSILSCYGWKIPGYANDWNIRRASFRINTDENGNQLENSDRYLLLEIDMQARKSGDAAIRLSVIPWAENFVYPQPRLKIDEPIDTEMEEQFP